jgi:type 2 lantibiotic biosynthesis protein LanM
MLSPADKRTIALRGRTLSERIASIVSLRNDPAPSETLGVNPSALEALDVWNRAFSPRDAAAFTRRLAWDGLDLEQALAVVSTRDPGDAHTGEPSWIAWLDIIARGVATPLSETAEGDLSDAWLYDERQLPFADLWFAIVRVAIRELRRACPAVAAETAPAALAAFGRQLAKELAFVGELTMYREFRSFADAASGDSASSAPGGSDRYRAFVRTTLDDGFSSLVTKYPFLARQIVMVIESWTSSISELLARLDDDRAAIAASFGEGREPGAIAGVEPGLSDPHHGRRRVAVLTFDSGLRLVYKPRDVGGEQAFAALLDWLTARGLQPAQRIMRVLERPGYGWVEFIEHQPFTSEAEVREYYQRSGGLLCLARLLRGRDLHWENVIASRGGPVIVDAELLVHPAAAGEAEASTLTTGLLSMLLSGPDGETVDIGGLRGERIAAGPTPERVWTGLGSDAIGFTEQRKPIPPKKNRVLLADAVVPPDDHADEILAGFEQTYRFVAAQRDHILALDGPLGASRKFRTRFLFRPSHQYAAALLALADPKYLGDGVRWGCALDALNRRFRYSAGPSLHPSAAAAPGAPPRAWALVGAEREALERLDLPYFWVDSDGTGVYAADTSLATDYFAHSGLDAVAEGLRKMGDDDLGAESRVLARALRQSTRSRFSAPLSLPTSQPNGQPADHRTILTAAAAWIGAEVLARADKNGVMHWRYALVTAPGSIAEHRLYDGTSGVALFLAALGAVTGEAQWIDAAAAACEPIKTIRRSARKETARAPIGAATGIGSLVYAMTTIGHLLNDASYTQLAVELAEGLTTEVIAADPSADVSDGCAGAVLALLAVQTAAPDEGFLARAAYCGRQLVARQVDAKEGAAWPSRDGVMLAGFAHGAAGIAYALARLYKETGDDAFLDAANRAHDYERSVFSAADRNWPVLGTGPESGVGAPMMTAWCHGAPGIVLARALSAELVGDPAMQLEIAAGIETTARLGAAQADHLCCGNLGRAEVLFTAGHSIRSLEPIGAALKIAGSVVKKARDRGHFKLSSSGFEYEVFDPGYFKGLSGIGYALLRFAQPAKLPSVLGFVAAPPASLPGGSRAQPS